MANLSPQHSFVRGGAESRRQSAAELIINVHRRYSRNADARASEMSYDQEEHQQPALSIRMRPVVEDLTNGSDQNRTRAMQFLYRDSSSEILPRTQTNRRTYRLPGPSMLDGLRDATAEESTSNMITSRCRYHGLYDGRNSHFYCQHCRAQADNNMTTSFNNRDNPHGPTYQRRRRTQPSLRNRNNSDVTSTRAISILDMVNDLNQNPLRSMRSNADGSSRRLNRAQPYRRTNRPAQRNEYLNEAIERISEMSYEELVELQERIGNVGSGLNHEAVEALLSRYKYQYSDKACCICLDKYTEGEDVVKLECRHKFHYQCIKQWLMRKNSCPLCKNVALKTDQ